MAVGTANPIFFPTPTHFRRWLETNHHASVEQWVGFYKKDSGRPSITWQESVDEALCFGWIDGLRRSLDESSYVIRFTPRKATSIWSAVNIGRVAALTAEGRMRPAGVRAFEKRSDRKSGIYSYEQRDAAKLDPAAEKKFRKEKKAWEFFSSRPPGYMKLAEYWVMTAKKEETRARRLDTLIEHSKNGLTVPQFTPSTAAKPKR
ncbi:MAG: YdeI/OmpD-associated family protein [Gemmatimonadota bacterium]|nr:YdeI/OmpD-associated family protein [Gemmatimonadota bacterium]